MPEVDGIDEVPRGGTDDRRSGGLQAGRGGGLLGFGASESGGIPEVLGMDGSRVWIGAFHPPPNLYPPRIRSGSCGDQSSKTPMRHPCHHRIAAKRLSSTIRYCERRSVQAPRVSR